MGSQFLYNEFFLTQIVVYPYNETKKTNQKPKNTLLRYQKKAIR